MNECTRYITATILVIKTQSLDEEMKLISQSTSNDNIIIDLQHINQILTVIWFRKLRASLVLYNKVLIGAFNPGICLENLKSASVPIIDDNNIHMTPGAPQLAVAEAKVTTDKNTNTSAFQTIIHHGHLRGGQSIKSKHSDIIVLGNLHYGAEIMAGGHIHILGALNGRALAGTHIGSQAIISAYSMRAELISIDGYYLSSDEIKQQDKPISIILQNEEICIRSFDPA